MNRHPMLPEGAVHLGRGEPLLGNKVINPGFVGVLGDRGLGVEFIAENGVGRVYIVVEWCGETGNPSENRGEQENGAANKVPV